MKSNLRSLIPPGLYLTVGVIIGVAISSPSRGAKQKGAADSAPKMTVCSGGELGGSGSTDQKVFYSFLEPDLELLLSADVLPAAQLEEFARSIEDGRVSDEKLARFVEILAARWPDHVMEFLDTLNPKVLEARRMRNMAIAKLALGHPEKAVQFLSNMDVNAFEGRELYDVGLQLMKNGSIPKEQISLLKPDMLEEIAQAEAESILRRQGVSGLVDWIGGLKSSTVRSYNAEGSLVSEKSGATGFALDRLSAFLQQTSSINKDQLFTVLSNSPFMDSPLESTTAFQVLARIDPLRALAVAEKITGSNAENAVRGAFIEVSESNSEIALHYLSNIEDKSRQNSLLTLLAACTTDAEIRKECEAILVGRNIELPATK